MIEKKEIEAFKKSTKISDDRKIIYLECGLKKVVFMVMSKKGNHLKKEEIAITSKIMATFLNEIEISPKKEMINLKEALKRAITHWRACNAPY